MRQPTRHCVVSADAALNVFTLGDPRNAPLVIVHGIRDVAASLFVIAEPLAERHYVVLPELRGHGDSAKSNHYSMSLFVYDLYRVIAELTHAAPVVVGHSLGGQIAAHHAALFPEQVRGLVIVEGLGPPDRRYDRDAETKRVAQRAQLLSTMQLAERGRPLPSVAFAAERLRANNPRLSEERAHWLAEHGTAIADDGKLYWKFDQRVGQTWLTTDPAQNRERWRAVQCPTLIVTADLAHEYWMAQMPIANWDGRFGNDELAERLHCFRNAGHVQIEGAGHMVHFDQPERLVQVIEDFLPTVAPAP